MTRRDPTIFCVLVAFAAGCTNKKEIESAKHSLYDTDFALVYSTALEATRELYPNIDDAPGSGKIATAWHQVAFASSGDDMTNPRVVAQSQGVNPNASPAAIAAGMPTRLAYKRYFIRFDVAVVGGRPWRVKVKGHAAEWDPGAAMPVEMQGMAKPPWLEPRIDALQVAIYKRIRQYAVPMKEEVKVEGGDEAPKTDPASFKGIPVAAAKLLAGIKDTLAKRDYGELRTRLDDDIVWSLGGGTGADVALATWQADPTAFEAMAAAVAAGCGGDDKQVKCPAGAVAAGKYQLLIEPRGDAWKVSSFVKAE